MKGGRNGAHEVDDAGFGSRVDGGEVTGVDAAAAGCHDDAGTLALVWAETHVVQCKVCRVDDAVQVHSQTRQVWFGGRFRPLCLFDVVEALPLDNTGVGKDKVNFAISLEDLLVYEAKALVVCDVDFVVVR